MDGCGVCVCVCRWGVGGWVCLCVFVCVVHVCVYVCVYVLLYMTIYTLTHSHGLSNYNLSRIKL